MASQLGKNSLNKPNLRQHKKNPHTQKTQAEKKQATLVDTARKRGGLLYTSPGTTRAKLLASRFASFLSPGNIGVGGRCRKNKFQDKIVSIWVRSFCTTPSVAADVSINFMEDNFYSEETFETNSIESHKIYIHHFHSTL